MADTSGLEEAFEWTRGELERRFGKSFSRRPVRLRHGRSHTFNAVADDESVIGQISHKSGPTRTGKNPAAKIKSEVAALYWLLQTQAPQRVLVLTHPVQYALVRQEVEGTLAENMQVLHIPLPPDLAEKVRKITERASDEMA